MDHNGHCCARVNCKWMRLVYLPQTLSLIHICPHSDFIKLFFRTHLTLACTLAMMSSTGILLGVTENVSPHTKTAVSIWLSCRRRCWRPFCPCPGCVVLVECFLQGSLSSTYIRVRLLLGTQLLLLFINRRMLCILKQCHEFTNLSEIFTINHLKVILHHLQQQFDISDAQVDIRGCYLRNNISYREVCQNEYCMHSSLHWFVMVKL